MPDSFVSHFVACYIGQNWVWIDSAPFSWSYAPCFLWLYLHLLIFYFILWPFIYIFFFFKIYCIFYYFWIFAINMILSFTWKKTLFVLNLFW